MNRIAVSIITGTVIVLGVLHSYNGGLLIQLERRVIYSNNLASSGSDSSLVVLVGLLGFVVALVGSVLNKAVLKTYFFSLIFLYVMLYLANLDVSLLGSVKLGDYLLLISVMVVHALGICHLTKRSS
jgi:hypothetical protein